MSTDHILQMPDGRNLGYAEYGDPSGQPLVYFHGGLSCALDIAFADGWCRENGVRILAPDRPGIRASSPLPGYAMSQTAADAEALAESLGIGQFALAGWSAGGPHAIATASLLGDRITSVATVGCPAPRRLKDLGLIMDRILYPASLRTPGLARLLIRVTDLAPSSIKESQTHRAVRSGADRKALDKLPGGEVAGWLEGATESGAGGVVDDYAATGADWTGLARATEAPVHIFHGDEDHLVPTEHARILESLIPHAQLHRIAESGHFLLFEHLAEVIQSAFRSSLPSGPPGALA